MSLFLSYLVLAFGLLLAAVLLRFAYALWELPYWKQRQLLEHYRKRMCNQFMVDLLRRK